MRQEFIDSIYKNCYIINLKRRDDRRKKVAKVFNGSKFKYKIFNAIDGRNLQAEGKMNSGQIGCLLSHIGVIELAKKQGFPCVFIMEDDVAVDNMDLLYARIEEFKDNVSDDFDVIYLCGQWGVKNKYFETEHIDGHVYTSREGMGGCIAYIVNSRIYDAVIKNFKNNRNYPIDTLYCTFLSDVGSHKGILGRDAKYYSSYKYPIRTYTNISDTMNNNAKRSVNFMIDHCENGSKIATNVIFHYGVPRSGNHGVLNWIKTLCKNECVHINNLQSELSYNNFIKYSQIDVTTRYIDEKWTGFNGIPNLIISLENKQINYDVIKRLGDEYQNVYLLCLVRDPFNNIASIVKFHNGCKHILNTCRNGCDHWKVYARLATSGDNRLNDIKFSCIIYDKWISDPSYRKSISNFLNLPHNEQNIFKIKGWGKSSFGNESNAKNLDLTGRYKSLKDNHVYKKFIVDNVIRILWERICKKYAVAMEDEEKRFISDLFKK